MDMPKTKLKDYENLLSERNELLSKANQGIISQDRYDSLKSKLENEYQDRIFPEDKNTFDNIDDFVKFFLINNLPLEQIKHEMIHAKKAEELGYKCQYNCMFLITEDQQIAYIPFIELQGKVNVEDYSAITSAPSNPSKNDRQTLDCLM